MTDPTTGLRSKLADAFSAPWTVYLAAWLPRVVLLAFLWPHPERCVYPDSKGYLALADHLLRLHQFTLGDGPDIFRTPGYPLFLLPFRMVCLWPVRWIALAQVLLSGPALAYFWKKLASWTSRRGAWWALAFLSFDWVLVAHTPLILADAPLALALMPGIAWTLDALRPSKALAGLRAGLLWGTMAILKPVTLYAPLLIAPLFLKARRTLWIFVLAAYSLPLAWVLRNVTVAHYRGFCSVGELHLIKYTASGIESLRTGQSYDTARDKLLAESGGPATQVGAATVLHHPGRLAQLIAIGFAKSLFGPGMEMFHNAEPAPAGEEPKAGISGSGTKALLREAPWIALPMGVYLLVLAASYCLYTAGLWRLWSSGGRLTAGLLTICPFYFLAVAADHGYYRFRIPALPFIAFGLAAFFARREKLAELP